MSRYFIQVKEEGGIKSVQLGFVDDTGLVKYAKPVEFVAAGEDVLDPVWLESNTADVNSLLEAIHRDDSPYIVVGDATSSKMYNIKEVGRVSRFSKGTFSKKHLVSICTFGAWKSVTYVYDTPEQADGVFAQLVHLKRIHG